MSLIHFKDHRKGDLGWIRSVAINLESQKILSGAKDRTIKMWNLMTDEKTYNLPVSSPVCL